MNLRGWTKTRAVISPKVNQNQSSEKTNPSLIFKDHPSLFVISSPDELLSVLSESGGFLGDAALVFKPFLHISFLKLHTTCSAPMQCTVSFTDPLAAGEAGNLSMLFIDFQACSCYR